MRLAILPPLLRYFVLVLACVLAASFCTSTPAQSRSLPESASSDGKIDLAQYESQLDSYSSSVAKLQHEPAEIARLRKSIPAQWLVRAGQVDANVSNEWLTTELWNLEHHPKDANIIARRIELRLAAMHKAAAQLEIASPSAPGARADLDKIFQRKEFRGLSGPTELQRLMARISQWLFEQVLKILRLLHVNANAGNVLAWAVIGIAFALLCYWIWTRLRSASLVTGAAPPSEQSAAMSSREWLAEALAAAERGDYREAVHCAYWAAITRLEDSGILARDRARTPRESLRQLDSRPNEQKPLRDLTRHFELIWYGYRPASAADWCGAKTQLEQMGCLKPSTAPTANS